MYPTKYPTQWQKKTIWAALTALCVVLLLAISVTLVWVFARVFGFLQPILMPVAIAAILAYLLDPLVTRLCRNGLGRTRAIVLLFVVAAFALVGLFWWLVPTISMQSANFAKELPNYTQKARDSVVNLMVRFDRTFGQTPSGARAKPVSTTRKLVDWLLPSPTPENSPAVSRIAAVPGRVDFGAPGQDHF